MKQIIFLFISIFISLSTSAQYTVTGGIGTPYEYTQNLSSTGISKVYVLNTLNGATIAYESSSANARFYRYQNSIADKIEIPSSDISTYTSGGRTTYKVSNLIDSHGYWVEESGSVRSPIWIIDYTQHQPNLNSIATVEEDDKCENLKLVVSKSDELLIYGINGGSRAISRRYSVSYDNQEWDDVVKKFVDKTEKITDIDVGTELIINSPIKSTQFTLSGDQFGEHFGIAKEIKSDTYQAIAVQGQIVTEQSTRDALNEVGRPTTETLGGSAPINITFYGYGSKNVGYYTWCIYKSSDLNNPIARYTDQDFSYEFTEGGNFSYKVVLETADLTSSCTDTTSVSFQVSESWLDIPNYFSPGDSPGSNDEFRVAYKSLVQFKCTIFNRWGVKLYEWTDPAKGWDGKYKGNYVNTGVYFYVIEAKGSEGKKYKKAGDINILRSK